MRVIPLHRESDSDYSCVSYWVLGDHNLPGDRNTLIDTGSRNPENLSYFLREMAILSKGIGKMAVEQVILTHDHFDHAGGLPTLARQFAPRIYSWTPGAFGGERILDGMQVTIGDQDAVFLHTPGHSADSVCIYLERSGSIFSGDSLFRILDTKGSYSNDYLRSLERLAGLEIRTIYPGHGNPITADAMSFIQACLENVRRSLIQ